MRGLLIVLLFSLAFASVVYAQGFYYTSGDDGHEHGLYDDPEKEKMVYYLRDDVSHFELLVFLFTHHPKYWGNDWDFEDAMSKLRQNNWNKLDRFYKSRNDHLEFMAAKNEYLEKKRERRAAIRAQEL